jgi:hypothetical protein
MSRGLDFRRVLDEVWAHYRGNAGPLISLAAVVFLPVAFLTALLENSSTVAGVLAQLLLSGPTTFLYAGLAAPVVVRARTGGLPAEPGDMLDSVQPVAAALLLAGLIWVITAVIGFALLIVPGVIWVTVTLLTASAITLERRGVIEAFGRSRDLVRGNGTTVLAILVALGIALIIAGLLLEAIGNAIGGAAGAFIGSWLAAVLTAPPAGLLPTVVFLDLGGEVEPIMPGGEQPEEEDEKGEEDDQGKGDAEERDEDEAGEGQGEADDEDRPTGDAEEKPKPSEEKTATARAEAGESDR